LKSDPAAVPVECLMRAAWALHIQDPEGGYLHWGADPSMHVRFDRGSAEIPTASEERQRFLGELARALRPATFTVDGNCTSAERDGIAGRRAEAVRARIVALGIDPGSINTESYGHTRPIVNPKSSRGQAANARVDIQLDLTWPPIPEDLIRQACPPGARPGTPRRDPQDGVPR